MHEYKNIKAFESSMSGVYSFNEPKERGIEKVEDGPNYMFYQNLKNMIKMANEIIELNTSSVEELLDNGHDWAEDHISVALENLRQVNSFLVPRIDNSNDTTDDHVDTEKTAENE